VLADGPTCMIQIIFLLDRLDHIGPEADGINLFLYLCQPCVDNFHGSI
jgi:hypothetical protein